MLLSPQAENLGKYGVIPPQEFNSNKCMTNTGVFPPSLWTHLETETVEDEYEK